MKRALVLCITVTAVGCTGGTEAVPHPRPGPSFSDADVNRAIQQLARSGIAVLDQPGQAPAVEPSEPVSPVRLLRWQVRAMALEVWAGAGETGDRLDALRAKWPSEGGADARR